MKRLSLAVAALPLLLSGTAVLAADLPRRAPVYVPPSMVPIFTWTGFYGGVNGGYSAGGFNALGRSHAGSPSGGFVGGTAGYNYELPNHIVVGVEGDLGYASVNNTRTTAGPLTSKGNLEYQTTIRGRVGYAMNRMLFYATGGYAGGSVHSTIYDTPNNYYAANSNFLNGYAVGGGVEYAIMPNVSGKVEYLYTDLSPAYNFVGTPDVTRVGLTTSSVKAGLNYHF